MVLPVINNEGDLLGVLDVDSDLPAVFTDAGTEVCQVVCATLLRNCRGLHHMAELASCLLTVPSVQAADRDGLQGVCMLLEKLSR